MTGNPSNSQEPKALTARRVTLLATVAALGGAMLLAGPGGYRPSSLGWTSAASAATTDSGTRTQPASPTWSPRSTGGHLGARQDRRRQRSGLMKEMHQDSDQEAVPFEPGSPMEKFFQQFDQQFGSQGMPHVRPHHEFVTGEGSGFFISPDGYAVTNNHVVDHAKSVQVTADDGTIYTAKVVGTDPKTDLALIKVDGKNDFPYVKFADHSPRVGDWVVAVGNPFGLGGTVTAGIVSARGRDIGAGPYDDYIQIDAPINKGNSGGPAFNEEGEVIGVNTAIYSPSGGSVGIGFDIPADTAKMVVAQLEKSGHVTRGWLGVQIQPVTAGIAESLGMKKAEGALVDEPQADSPAAKAGVQTGDVITAVNGTPVKDARELARTIGMMAPNSTVKLDIVRQGQEKTLSLTLAEMPNEHVAKADAEQAQPTSGVPHLGLSVAPAAEVSVPEARASW